ncbi:S8 family serine peptidase [Haloferula helveola]|uniref:S8 family serine peptidase n=1 Tax=Haloferula helveola TaxID=490095 RepID=UPI0030D13BDA
MPSSRTADDGRDLPMFPTGAVSDACWALARLNDAESAPDETVYAYPDTPNKVRLYLIDTAVDNSGGWFDTNENLTVGNSIIVGGDSGSSAFLHGTQMLSIIAGPGSGAAQGTPIEVVSFDVYPDGEGSASSAGLVADAVLEATEHFQLNGGTALICIASGSAAEGQSSTLRYAIESAVEEGLPVVVSAGNNNGADASRYVPSAYGSTEGVVCVGATGIDNEVYPVSNIGEAVDLYAPGDAVVCFGPGGIETAAYGTSPATALATAAALIELSINPALSPAELEARLKTEAFAAEVALLQISTDSDSDGMDDELETFFGSNPFDRTSRSRGLHVDSTRDLIEVSMEIPIELLTLPGTQVLSDGRAWRIWRSNNLSEWSDLSWFAVPTVVLGETGLASIRFAVPAGESRSYYQLEVSPDGDTWATRSILLFSPALPDLSLDGPGTEIETNVLGLGQR